MHDFDWFIERLEVAKWTDEEQGSRDCLTNCPVHGGSDSLHLTEKNGKALVRCFNPACGAGYTEVADALESDAGVIATTPAQPSLSVPTITRRGRRVQSGSTSAGQIPGDADGATETGGSTPPRLHQDPLEWAAQRCGMSKTELLKLGLPISSHSGKVAFVFDGSRAIKLRGTAEGKKKDIAWVNDGARPDLWPVPIQPGAEITITEGEFDAICLRKSGIEAYSTTAGAGTPIDQVTWEVLRELGVQSVNIVFDLDREGRKGRDVALQDARQAGIMARPMRPDGINPLVGDKDVRDAVFQRGYPVTLVDDVTEDAAVSLDSITPAPVENLLLGWLHPHEHTVLFGDGGTGKGVIAAQWAVELVRDAKKTVLVVDYEQHAMHEWRPRVGRFACPHPNEKDKTGPHMDPPCPEARAVLERVFYVQPVKPIWDIASWLRSEAQRVGADYLIVDSVSYAVEGMEPEKSVTAVKYTQAINAVGLPIMSIGHVTKADASPRHPFGSVYWHNGARITIGVARRDDALDSDRIITHRKANQGQHQADVAIDWTWVTGDLPGSLTPKVAYGSAQDAFNALTAQTGQFATLQDVIDATGNTDLDDGNFRQWKSRYMALVKKHKMPPVLNRVRRSAPDDVGSEDDGTNTDD